MNSIPCRKVVVSCWWSIPTLLGIKLMLVVPSSEMADPLPGTSMWNEIIVLTQLEAHLLQLRCGYGKIV